MSGTTKIASLLPALSEQPIKLYIGGKWVEGDHWFETIDPSTGQVLATLIEGREKDIDQAVQAAREAFDAGPWGNDFTPSDRARMLWRLADLIEEHSEEFAVIESLDVGKPISTARRVDIPRTVAIFRYFSGWATKIHGETIASSVHGMFTYTVREPVGVVGGIIPWNFPLLMCAYKLAPSLAAGNTVVLKPAEQAPLAAMRLAQLIDEAGFPRGVVNIVPGLGPTAGATLASHAGVDKISFTGEYATGQKIIEASKGNLKPVTLELGGKSPNIIMADADFAASVEGAFRGIFFNQGEACVAGSRLLVHASIEDELISHLVERAGNIRLGPGLDEGTEMGPLVSEEQLRRVLGYIGQGKSEGAQLLCGGERERGSLAKGFFVQPTVFADVHATMTIAQEEIFGPVLSVMTFRDIEEAIRIANNVRFGLAAAVWTRDVVTAHRMASALKAGTIWVNAYGAFDPAVPYGGYKMSGYGRELGYHALEAYTQIKSVWVNLG